MSRSDYPPGYNDSYGPLYAPQGYPPPPTYGFSGPQPGQPSAPYPPGGPNAPLYTGQPGGYPPGPYPGQPHPDGPPRAGYPNHPPMPPVIPPTIPTDVLSSGDEFAASGSGWDSMSIRHAFIRKRACQSFRTAKPSCVLGIICCVYHHPPCAGLL